MKRVKCPECGKISTNKIIWDGFCQNDDCGTLLPVGLMTKVKAMTKHDYQAALDAASSPQPPTEDARDALLREALEKIATYTLLGDTYDAPAEVEHLTRIARQALAQKEAE